MNVCIGSCTLDKKGMINIKSSIAYIFCNLCSQCSYQGHSVWFLKWVNRCPCCDNPLRRKSKHRLGREKITYILNSKR